MLWGSGFGADTADSDTVFSSLPHPVNQSSTKVYIGDVEASVVYAGSSGYPGLDQIDVTIPANVGVGCRVSVVAIVSGVASNFVLIPINPGGGVCSDPMYNYDGTQLAAALTATVTTGIVQIEQLPGFPLAAVNFVSNTDGNAYTALGPLSLGGCTVQQGTGPAQYGGTLKDLSVGTVTLQGPEGTYTLPTATGGLSERGDPCERWNLRLHRGRKHRRGPVQCDRDFGASDDVDQFQRCRNGDPFAGVADQLERGPTVVVHPNLRAVDYLDARRQRYL